MGFRDIFRDTKSLWCTQHLEARDVEKLRSLGCNQSTTTRIMGDIHGSQNNIFLLNGLADAEDKQDFGPGLYDWFQKMGSNKVKECLILSARTALGISGCFTSNGLELKHKLQKKKLTDDKRYKDVGKMTVALKEWAVEVFFSKQQKLYEVLVNIVWQLHVRNSMLIHYDGLSGRFAVKSSILQQSIKFIPGLVSIMKSQKLWAFNIPPQPRSGKRGCESSKFSVMPLIHIFHDTTEKQ